MEFLEVFKAAILGIIQGITEWLPVSSTGHMILANEFIRMNLSDDFVNMFLVVVQLGSILAVVWLYFHKLNPFSPRKSLKEKQDTYSLWFKVLVAVVPAAIIGLLFEDQIDAIFYNSWAVAATLILYGILFIVLENRKARPRFDSFSGMTYLTALLIGAFQMLALIPGTSRSGATILGAVFLGASRGVAAEFSFFLAIPMMFGASGLKLVKYVMDYGIGFSGTELAVLLTGLVVAFLVSIAAIKFLMGYIQKHDFKAFGYYRIILGLVVIGYFLLK